MQKNLFDHFTTSLGLLGVVWYVDNQQKVYNDEDNEKRKCDQCNSGFLKKWMVAKHVKETHIEEKIYDQPQIDGKSAYNVDI